MSKTQTNEVSEGIKEKKEKSSKMTKEQFFEHLDNRLPLPQVPNLRLRLKRKRPSSMSS